MSLLLIADPECGKTSIVNDKKCEAIKVFADVTGRGIVEICKESPQITHIVLNDMVAIMSHRDTVNKYTQSMLNALTEEGIGAIATPGGVEQIANGRRGVIACITSDLVKDGRTWWNKIGFATRMMPFSYTHSMQLELLIKASIDKEANQRKKRIQKKKQDELRIPLHPKHVEIPPNMLRLIRIIADQKSKEIKREKGYRRLKQFQSLACGHALLRNPKKPEVRQADIDFLNRVFPYISYENLHPL